MLNIEPQFTGKIAFLHLGFRPFFFSAIAFAVVSIALWMMMYSFGHILLPKDYPILTWHAHEMIFGFSTAVITGFLLTAVKNWTGIQTIQHKSLLAVFIIWLCARVLPFIPTPWTLPALAIIDSLFLLIISVAFSYPVFKTKQWKNIAFSGKLLLLFTANCLFYIGLLGYWDEGIRLGLYGGFYTILGVIFNMGRRVIPFFIEKGLGCPFEAKNHRWVDMSSLWLFLGFSVADVIKPDTILVAVFAAALVLLHSVRLYGWYHKAVWKKSLLWVLVIGYAWIILGFALKISSVFFGTSPQLALHAFAYGGIGMITSGMMARVSLGHTGNNVFNPPKILHLIFALIFIGALIRVIFPLFLDQHYHLLITLSQGLWIAAFTLFFIKFSPMLIKARTDGRFG